MVLRMLLSGERKWCERQSANQSEKSEFCGLHDHSNVRLRSVFRARVDVNARPSSAESPHRTTILSSIFPITVANRGAPVEKSRLTTISQKLLRVRKTLQTIFSQSPQTFSITRLFVLFSEKPEFFNTHRVYHWLIAVCDDTRIGWCEEALAAIVLQSITADVFDMHEAVARPEVRDRFSLAQAKPGKHRLALPLIPQRNLSGSAALDVEAELTCSPPVYREFNF